MRHRAPRWHLVAVVIAVLAASGCSSGSSGSQVATTPARGAWPAVVCRQVARGAVREGAQALLHYRPPLSNYPPDVALQGVRIAVGGLIRHRCPPQIVGAMLSRRLTRKEQAELYPHLPPRIASYLRRGVASS